MKNRTCIRLDFQTDTEHLSKYLVIENSNLGLLTASRHQMLRMLSYADPETPLTTLEEQFQRYIILPDESSETTEILKTHTIRQHSSLGDFYTEPEEQVSDPVIALVYTDNKPVCLALYVPCNLINNDCDGSALRLVLSDIAAEATDRDISEVFWQDFTKAPEELLSARNIRMEKIEPYTVIDDEPILNKTEYTATVFIPEKDAAYIERALTDASVMSEDDTYTVTAKFPDGKQMDIKCCGSSEEQTAWTEAVLFTAEGYELVHSEVEEEFTGTWELSYNNITYMVDVKIGLDHEKLEKLRESAYQRYKLDWMESHGYSITDLLNSVISYLNEIEPDGYPPELFTNGALAEWELNCGFNGELWACKDEFLSSEYQDEDYMQTLLTAQEYNLYMEERGICPEVED